MLHSFCSSLLLEGLRCVSIVYYTIGNYKALPSFSLTQYKEIQRETYMPPLKACRLYFSPFRDSIFREGRKIGRKKGRKGETEGRKGWGREGGKKEEDICFSILYAPGYGAIQKQYTLSITLPAHQPTKKSKRSGEHNCFHLFTLEKVPILSLELETSSF